MRWVAWLVCLIHGHRWHRPDFAWSSYVHVAGQVQCRRCFRIVAAASIL